MADDQHPQNESASVDRELLTPPDIDPYAKAPQPDADELAAASLVAEAPADDAPADDAVAGEGPVDGAPIDEDAPSSTESAAAVTSAGGSTMARRVRKARRVRRGQKAVARRRSFASAVAHTFGAFGAIALVGATTYTLGWLPIPEFHAVADSIEIAPAPGQQQRVCPGPLQQLGLSSVADQAQLVGTADVTIASSTEDYESITLGENDTDEAASTDDPGAVSVEAPGEIDGETTILSATQSVSVATDDSVGLSVTNCTQPTATQWVAGGATTLGHTLVLDVVNPGHSEARVNFEVYGIDGVVVPGFPETVIAPGQSQALSLAGIAPNANALAIKVTSTGAPVAAFLHETITDTLTPKGSDIVGSTALPSTLQTLPGIFVYGRPDADVTTLAEIGTTLRILNPNDQAANATLTAYDANGIEAFSEELELTSYRVVELPFADVPEGEYTITLEADVPVLLAGRVSPLNGNEFAWIPSSAALVGNELAPVAEGPDPRLSVFNPADEERDVTINGTSVTLAPHETYQATVPAGSTVALDDASGLTAAMHYSGSGQLASISVRPGNADAEPIRIVK